MNRRTFLKQTGQTAGAVVASSVLSFRCSQGLKPNIIFILADDLGYGDLSCYGQTRFQTPNIDRLAAEGTKFTDHYAGSTVCAPSRASLMTGFHTGHCYVRGNYETGPFGFGACLELRPEDVTVQELLRQQGYVTGMYGKWGLGVMTTTGQPDKQGVDEWFGYLNQAHAHFYYPEYLWKNGERIELPGNKDGKETQYAHDLIVDEALDFIERHKEEPFFLYMPVTIPHAEMKVPQESIEPFLGKWEETPYNVDGSKHYGTQLHPKAAFAGMVSRLDRDVGRVLDLLKDLGIDDNTLVIFTSDNGPHHEGGHDPQFFDSNGPLRGGKRDLYEGGIRVPMIARWPGHVQAGSITDHVSAFWDFLPTACELSGITVPINMDGISYVPTLLGHSDRQKQHDYLYWEFHENPTTDQAVRMGKWKAVRHYPSGPVELYNLETDIGEQENIADEHPDIVEHMKRILESARTPHKIWNLKDK